METNLSDKKIAVLLSGGVDSAVAVHELASRGLHPDCFYIKMYILAPLAKMVEAFGPKHRYGDEKRRSRCGE